MKTPALSVGALWLLLLPFTTNAAQLRNATAHRKLQLTCNIEEGVDYVDNDIRSVSNRPIKACCDECDATSGCAAWSWSNYNGGTCWLKSRKGATSTNPGVTSGTLASGPPPSCNVIQGVDYAGNDIANVPASFAGACCDICKNWPVCAAFSWSNYNGGTCWLKNAKGTVVNNPAVSSGEVTPSQPGCSLETGVDYVDNDIDNVHGYPDPKQCCDVCKSWTGCRSFSWTSQDGGTCWLKSRKGTTVANANVVSCQVLPNLQSACAALPLQYDVDYVDNDIASFRQADPTNCCDLCLFKVGCHAFSWSNYLGGTCWLKSAKGSIISRSGVISGVIFA